MRQLQQAIWLAKFELKHSIKGYVLVLLIFIAYLFLLTPMISEQSEQAVMGFDFNFLFGICVIPLLVQPRLFQGQHLGNYFYAAPMLIMSQQLPVSRREFLTYKLTYHLISATIFSSIFLGMMYQGFQDFIPFANYASVMLIWIAVTFTLRMITARFELGSYFLAVIGGSLLLGIIIFPIYGALFFFHYQNGFVFWTIEMAELYPYAVAFASLCWILISGLLWYLLALRKIQKTDYFN